MSASVEIISAISGAIAGGIVSCIFKYFNDCRKERREDEKEKQKENQRFFENRPEFKIIKAHKLSNKFNESSKKDCLRAVVAEFKDSIEDGFVYANFSDEEKNANDWISVRYKLKNVGKTDISLVCLICQDKRHFCLYDDYLTKNLMQSRCLHYTAYYENKIRIGEQFEIEIFYHKKHDYLPMLDIGMEDPNGNIWTQALHIPCEKVGDSKRIKYNDYLDATKTEIAEDCFKHPWMW